VANSNLNNFIEKINSGRPCLGSAVTFADLSITEALAVACDFIWIDLEHSPNSIESMVGHLIACRAAKTPAFVRIPSGEIGWIKRVLDNGADGIILPQAKTYEEIKSFVDACYYPPNGTRGFGPRRPTDYGRLELNKYLDHASKNIFVCAQIESKSVVKDLDRIVEIPGLDSLCLGPMDLSGSVNKLGKTSDPEVIGLIETTVQKGREAGLYLGMGMGAFPEAALEAIKIGIQWCQCGSDMELVVNGAEKMYSDIRNQI